MATPGLQVMFSIGNVVTKSWGAMEEVLYKQTKSFDKWIFWRTFCILYIIVKNCIYWHTNFFLNRSYHNIATDICAILDVSFQNTKYLYLITKLEHYIVLSLYIFLNQISDFYMVWYMSTDPKNM